VKEESMTSKVRRSLLARAGIAALALGGAALAGAAGGGDDNERPITGAALEQAKSAALEHTGGGTVTETEVGDEESLYEVEVTSADGTHLDVQLDEGFTVVGDEADGESETDDD
jgi:hypothetical protein